MEHCWSTFLNVTLSSTYHKASIETRPGILYRGIKDINCSAETLFLLLKYQYAQHLPLGYSKDTIWMQQKQLGWKDF